MRGNVIALYLRLSLEDMDARKEKARDESDSIRSQRLMLQNYVRSKPEFAGRQVVEFADDGFTGTNFERPQFQKMMERVRTGEIACIIVKDLSRFGRNYLEVGDYLEHLFPFLGVRFIAVNDHYDSNDYTGSTGGLDVAFRNLVYQRYSQDLSEKVKSAKHIKMAQGKYIPSCPYGYKKKEGIKDKMFLDPETAPIVKEIFDSVINGMKTTEVAASLNERGILTPEEYKKRSRGNFQSEAMWSHQAVLRIIKDYKYTGAMVSFKCESRTIRAKVQYRRPPEEWVVIEGSHDPIVSHEEYAQANAKIRKVRPYVPKRTDGRDRVYYCGHCGRKLRKTYGLDEYYSCATQLYRKNSKCEAIFWSRKDIENVVFTAYRAQLDLMNEKYQETEKKTQADPLRENRQRQRALAFELERADAKNLQLYEEYREGIWDKDTFLQKKGLLFERKQELSRELEKEQAREEELRKSQRKEQEKKEQLAAAGVMLRIPDEELKKRMYDDIEKVTVYDSKKLEITWKWDDVFHMRTCSAGS